MEEKEIGSVAHYFGKVSVGLIKLTDSLKVGDSIRIKGNSADFTQTVDSMQVNHQTVSQANAGDEAGIKVAQKVRENDKVYKVTP